MPNKTMRPLPAFNGVAAGSIATLNVPIGLTLHQVIIAYSGVTLAQLNEIRVKGNGRELMVVNEMTNLDIINQFEGRAAANGLIVLDFERKGLLTLAGIEFTALGTGAPQNNDPKSPNYNPTPLSTLQIEIDIDGAAAAPILSAKSVSSAPRPLGMIKHLRKFIFNPTAAGDFEVADLPKGLLINKIYIQTASGNLNGVKIDRDNFRTFDRTEAENNLVQIDGKRVPQSNWFVIDPSETGDGNATISTLVSDLRFICNMSAADTLTFYVEYIGPFAG